MVFVIHILQNIGELSDIDVCLIQAFSARQLIKRNWTVLEATRPYLHHNNIIFLIEEPGTCSPPNRVQQPSFLIT